MFKSTANTSKKYTLTANDFKHIDMSKEKNSNILKTQSVSEKDPSNLQIVNPLYQKRTWPFKKLHGKQKVAHVSRTFANNRNNITIEMNKCIGFWTSKCTKPAQGQNKKTLQSTWEGANIYLKYSEVIVCFCMFVRARLVHFEIQDLCCFVPARVWCDSSLAAFLFDMCLRNK